MLVLRKDARRGAIWCVQLFTLPRLMDAVVSFFFYAIAVLFLGGLVRGAALVSFSFFGMSYNFQNGHAAPKRGPY